MLIKDATLIDIDHRVAHLISHQMGAVLKSYAGKLAGTTTLGARVNPLSTQSNKNFACWATRKREL